MEITFDKELLDVKDAGTVEFGNRVIAADPCYDMSVRCKADFRVKPGKYRCLVVWYDTESWGWRVDKMYAIHEDVFNTLDFLEIDTDGIWNGMLMIDIPYFSKAVIGVDSGQCGFFDYDYFAETRDDEDWYLRVCGMTVDNNREPHFFTGGVMDNKCFAASSGYGDGSYALYTNRKDDDDEASDIFCLDFGVAYDEDDD